MAEFSQDQKGRAEIRNPAGGRLDSLDIARGVLILLVVFVHSYGHNFVYVAGPGTISNIWDVAVSATKPIRMPAFFLISGFLAKSLIRQSWGALLKKRIAFLMYMYIAWLFISTTVFEYMDYAKAVSSFSAYDIITSTISDIIIPYSFLWFLWALSLYNVLAKATLRVPLWIVLGGAMVASGLSEQLSEQPSYIVRCAVYFLIGARYPDFVTQLSTRATWKSAAGLSLAYVLSVGLILLLGEKFPGVWLPAGIIGSAALIMIANLVSSWPGLNFLKYCGRNTLQLYVLHPILIGIVTFLEIERLSPMVMWFRSVPLMLFLHPLLFVAGITMLSLVVWMAFVRAGLGVLFEAPWGKSRQARPSAILSSESNATYTKVR